MLHTSPLMPQICSVTFTYRNSTVLQRIIYSERLFTFLWLLTSLVNFSQQQGCPSSRYVII